MEDPLYGPFVEYARKFGIDAALESFASIQGPLLDQLEQRFRSDLVKVEAGGPPIIAAGGNDWYSGPGPQDRIWPALEQRYRDEGWSEERIASVDDASNMVVAHTPRPGDPDWRLAKGLVVGYVQSGKTTNFTAVVAKLADLDYRLVIVLSGIHNGLRKQTQLRLDEYLKRLVDDRWFTMTDENKDFDRPTHQAAAALAADRTVLAVVKKNPTVLRKLVKWLDTPSGRKALAGSPVVIIDDEADQASVATDRINPLIRKLLSIMPKCTYIGYTATPFANVFIDPREDDLYPETFILNLPRPAEYFGPEKIFGRTGVEGDPDGEGPQDGYDMVRYVDEDDLHKLRPHSRKQADDFEPEMIDELVDAVRWFWLATAARRARGDSDHSTMLIHTSVKTTVHEKYRDPLEAIRAAALRELAADGAQAREVWRDRWESEAPRVPAEDFGRRQNSFDDVFPHLEDVIASTTVILDNSKSEDRLDYSRPSVVAIAVGGNTLSRGLTLEGLVVSFFVRGATAYDTLLQMGRWFGYRKGFEDLPRIWMTPSLADAFRHLATVEYEMRADIDRYQEENLTPRDVAVRIRTHPSLRITAKMGAAKPAYVSYAGRRLQTRYFLHRDAEWLARNALAGETLIHEARRAGAEPERSGSATLIRDVPVDVVRRFLQAYQVHEDSPDLDTGLMVQYIDHQAAHEIPALRSWSVALVNGGDEGEAIDLGGLSARMVVRSRLNDHRSDRADIKTLMSKEDRVVDLGLAPGEARKLGEADLVALRHRDALHHDRGLVVLYAIDPDSEPAKDSSRAPGAEPARLPLNAVAPVIGMGIVFPGETKLRKIISTHVAVDLTDLEVVNLDEELGEGA